MPSTSMLYGIGGTSITGRVTFGYSTLEALERLELTGAGTYDVDLAWAPSAGVKGILITFDTLDAGGVAVTSPITITWTSGAVSKSEELSPGGMFSIASPTPVNGVTALSIVTTANAVVHVAVAG